MITIKRAARWYALTTGRAFIGYFYHLVGSWYCAAVFTALAVLPFAFGMSIAYAIR